ncbi:DUF2798 domain-containing protein [Pontibacter fetidus]|uniref:DUF2798 domain-containing protein n=1 Tax=Pontibacter fetidus TaxID=2700082 RepID=A0A6B2GYQ8_9BACT|nr:DUF2798 domain-containing protein [Pontibacter fetidus]NDK56109.1 DUF2798 domain-containing protein [Pontibacter fetidus]
MKKALISAQLKTKLLVILIISILLASALELYTFGIPSDFIVRWFNSFFVIFFMISITVLGIVPAVNYAVNKAAGR